MRERKRLIRLLVTDVTLLKTGQHIRADIRLPGGQQHQLTVPRPRTAWEQHSTPPHPGRDRRTARRAPPRRSRDHPQRARYHGGWGRPFSTPSLMALRRNHNIPTLRQRLRAGGMLTVHEIAEHSASPRK